MAQKPEGSMDATSAHQDSLPVTSDALIARLDAMGISYDRFDHVPLMTVQDSKAVQGVMRGPEQGGVHIKNLYLRDRKKRNFLVTLEQDREVDLKALGALIEAQNLSFGSPDRLMEFLGIRPGAVSPLAMVTGAGAGVTLVLDAAIRRAEMVYVHPLVNDRTLGLRPEDLLRFLGGLGVEPIWLE
jgi:Ala-tRNA(Pro) deacylase